MSITKDKKSKLIESFGNDKKDSGSPKVQAAILSERIKNLTNSKITIPDPKIIEYKEALIFSFLGLLRFLEINNCYSSVTGAKKDHCSGKIYTP